eukprot:CAMPEP_0172821266 /NCGR_PEP_ID=MMETSP1075-20121228/15830_1 /TAXON_ID=2916 /ORGANISM="Ceratium fusus, Strain PA161109" /LENGTH=92 /DNA_ID=CAMNT_0013662071 /DNA_START=126 /DNA_END=404 /DNA_ORIENTATION=+
MSMPPSNFTSVTATALLQQKALGPSPLDAPPPSTTDRGPNILRAAAPRKHQSNEPAHCSRCEGTSNMLDAASTTCQTDNFLPVLTNFESPLR